MVAVVVDEVGGLVLVVASDVVAGAGASLDGASPAGETQADMMRSTAPASSDLPRPLSGERLSWIRVVDIGDLERAIHQHPTPIPKRRGSGILNPSETLEYVRRIAELASSGKFAWKPDRETTFSTKVGKFDVRISSKDK